MGVPTLHEPLQTTDDFNFDFDGDFDVSLDLGVNIDPSLYHEQSLGNLQVAPNLTLKTDFQPSEVSQPLISNEQYMSHPYDLADHSSYNAQQNYAYPEPRYHSAHEAPYFNDYSYNNQVQLSSASASRMISCTVGIQPQCSCVYPHSTTPPF